MLQIPHGHEFASDPGCGRGGCWEVHCPGTNPGTWTLPESHAHTRSQRWGTLIEFLTYQSPIALSVSPLSVVKHLLLYFSFSVCVRMRVWGAVWLTVSPQIGEKAVSLQDPGSVPRGSRQALHCTSHGVPPPHIQWLWHPCPSKGLWVTYKYAKSSL